MRPTAGLNMDCIQYSCRRISLVSLRASLMIANARTARKCPSVHISVLLKCPDVDPTCGNNPDRAVASVVAGGWTGTLRNLLCWVTQHAKVVSSQTTGGGSHDDEGRAEDDVEGGRWGGCQRRSAEGGPVFCFSATPSPCLGTLWFDRMWKRHHFFSFSFITDRILLLRSSEEKDDLWRPLMVITTWFIFPTQWSPLIITIVYVISRLLLKNCAGYWINTIDRRSGLCNFPELVVFSKITSRAISKMREIVSSSISAEALIWEFTKVVTPLLILTPLLWRNVLESAEEFSRNMSQFLSCRTNI